ncbi:hypothetical protein HRbin17_01918 [bacterium HR17]|uniref:Heme exporter protein B n=1 Tax=Candidatus Fervidibacter japonicus TaxID=2035412 RepID=A0A2H5XDZ7_9BACT|nr:hypothetical protein HRbin17_01918 [bacterium HR17]
MATGKSSWAPTQRPPQIEPTARSAWWRQALAITAKDLRQEWRTRHASATAIAFALIALTAVSLSVGSLRTAPDLAAGVLWVVLFFAAVIALGRAFTKEEDAHTADVLRLNADPIAVFAGKCLFNFALLTAVSLVTVPLFAVVMELPLTVPSALAIAVIAASVAMAALGTLLGAILAKAQSRGALLGVAAFPVFFPALAAALQATAAAFGAAPDPREPLQFLCAYAGAAVLGGALLFEAVW